MHKISFTVKDLEGFSFSIGEMDSLVNDYASDASEAEKEESFINAMNEYQAVSSWGNDPRNVDNGGECGICYDCHQTSEEAFMLPFDVHPGLTVNMCKPCAEKRGLTYGDIWNQRNNPGGPDEAPALCIKLNKEQRVANCTVCGNSNTFNQGPQIYVEGTNDIVCEPCLCHFDDEPGEPTPLQVASKEICSLWYFAVGDWNRSHKQSK